MNKTYLVKGKLIAIIIALLFTLFYSTSNLRAEEIFTSLSQDINSSLDSNKIPKAISIIPYCNLTDTSEKYQVVWQQIIGKIEENLLKIEGITITERARLNKILQEFSLSKTGLIDPSTAAELGKLTGAHALIFGNIRELGDSFETKIDLVTVEKGEKIFTKAFSVKKSTLIPIKSAFIVGLKSAFIPGIGQFELGQNFKGNLFAFGEVGLIAGIVAVNNLQTSAYENARNATVRSKRDDYYNQATNYYNTSRALSYVAAALWIYNVFDAYSGTVSYNKSLLEAQNDMGLMFCYTDSNSFSLSFYKKF